MLAHIVVVSCKPYHQVQMISLTDSYPLATSSSVEHALAAALLSAIRALSLSSMSPNLELYTTAASWCPTAGDCVHITLQMGNVQGLSGRPCCTKTPQLTTTYSIDGDKNGPCSTRILPSIDWVSLSDRRSMDDRPNSSAVCCQLAWKALAKDGLWILDHG